MKRISWILAAIAVLVLALSVWRIIAGNAGSQVLSEGASNLPPVPESTRAEAPLSAEGAVNLPLAAWGFDFPQGDFPAMEFTAMTLSGESRSLKEYEGNLLILNFWATWCPPCREEIPSMERMMEELEGSGISLLAISSMEDRSTVEAFVEEQSMSLTVALDESGEISSLYGIQNIPTTYLIDSRGNFVARKVGSMEWDDPALISQLASMK